MGVIRVYPKESTEYKRLELACKLFTALSPNGSVYKLDDIYFDYGQDWMYTAPVTYCKDGESFQSLCPRDYKKVVQNEDTLATVHEIVNSPDWTQFCADRL